jgi:hypothetical protein
VLVPFVRPFHVPLYLPDRSERRRWRNFIDNESQQTSHGGLSVRSIERRSTLHLQASSAQSAM